MGLILGKIVSTVAKKAVIKQVGKTAVKTAGKIMVTNAIIKNVTDKSKKEDKEKKDNNTTNIVYVSAQQMPGSLAYNNPNSAYVDTPQITGGAPYSPSYNNINPSNVNPPLLIDGEVNNSAYIPPNTVYVNTLNNTNTARNSLNRKSNTIKVPKLKVFKGMNYLDGFKSLQATGFENITYRVLRNLKKDNSEKNGIIKSVSINGKTSFEESARVSKYSPVIITYRTLGTDEGEPMLSDDFINASESIPGKRRGDIEAPKTSLYKKTYYLDGFYSLNMLGFTNIKFKIKKKLKREAYKKNGMIKSISINGKTIFTEGEKVSKSAPVVIKYLTFANGQGTPLLPPEEIQES